MTSETQAQEMRAKIADQVAAKGKKKSRAAWIAPSRLDFTHGVVLALDQTLTSTGFSVVSSDYTGLHILEGNMVLPKIDEGLTSFEETFAKAASMGSQFDALMVLMGSQVEVIVHEMPSVQGYRTESSLMAAREVRRAASQYASGVLVVMVSNRSMRALLNPPHERMEKRFVKSAIEVLIPVGNIAAKRWNADVTDSVGLALTYLHQKDKP